MKSQKKVLIVDDEVNFTKLLSAFLNQRGYEVAVVHDGKGAVEMVKLFCPDVILLDLGLPDLSGDLTALRIKSENKKRAIPIIVVTGHGDSLSQSTARAVGCEDFIVKPVDLKDLCNRVERVLGEAPS